MRNKKLSNRILYALFVLLFIAILNQVPSPGVDRNALKEMINANSSLGLLNAMSGNAIANVSILTLSITPYITASIIIQLLEVCVPKLSEIKKDGKRGEIMRKRIQVVLSFVIGSIQATGMAIGYHKTGIIAGGNWNTFLVAAVWVAGAMVVVFLAESFEKRGIGNGVSIILAFNILGSYAGDVLKIYSRFIQGEKMRFAIRNAAICLAIVFVLFLATVVLQTSEKKLTVVYSAKTGGIQKHIIPIKPCPGSVIPIIFASTLFNIPVMILSLVNLNKAGKVFTVLKAIQKGLDMNSWFDKSAPIYTIGAIFYIALIFFFSSFYCNIMFNPIEIADNMKRQGGYIEGVRSGIATEDFIKSQTKHTVRIGAAGLSIIALIPLVLGGVFGLPKLSFLGTSVIITTGVIIETRKAIAAEANYSFMRKNGVFTRGETYANISQ